MCVYECMCIVWYSTKIETCQCVCMYLCVCVCALVFNVWLLQVCVLLCLHATTKWKVGGALAL